MINRVLTLPEIDDVPIVLIANSVAKQTDGWYTAQGNIIPAPRSAINRMTVEILAHLYRDAPGRYVVFGEEAILDKIGDGPSLQDYGGNWTNYRVEGDEPDTDPESEPGARKAVTNRVIKLAENPPTDISEQKPLMVGDVKVIAIKKSISSTTGEIDLKKVAEKGAKAYEL